MKTFLSCFSAAGLILSCLLAVGCGRQSVAPIIAESKPAQHEHHTPHGGTPVVLGDEAYHLELVLDRANGKLQAFVLDGEMENFVRSTAPSFEVAAMIDDEKRPLIFSSRG